ncbi:MAG: hypothetical protein QOJ38_1639 [Solirubrobacterales bacterium]|nr:hypothetical protein [Solirubrobacterales bacterium]
MSARGGAISTVVVSLLALAPGAAARTPEQALRAARAPVAELQRTETIGLRNGARVYRYRQLIDGIPVLDAAAAVVDPPGAAAAVVADSTARRIDPPGSAAIDRRQALAAALAALGPNPALRHPPRAGLTVVPQGGGRLAWRVDVDSTTAAGAEELLVDARSGALFARRSLSRDATGHARLYLPSPTVENGGIAGLADNHDRDSALLTALRRNVRLQRIKHGQSCLVGSYAYALLRSSRVCKRHRNFSSIRRSDDRFEALMAYFHVDRTQAYITSLGFSANHRRQRVSANAFSIDNSEYDPFDRTIRLGSGGVDDGEDGDVIVHEYGHAVQDALVPNFGIGTIAGSIGEGWGDYLAAVMSVQTPGTNEEDAVCVFEWDGLGSCERRIPFDSLMTISAANASCDGDPHCIGEVWSSALWSLRDQLGADSEGFDVIDSDAIVSNALMTAKLKSWNAAGQTLLDADAALYSGSHLQTIQDELVAHEICTDQAPGPDPDPTTC